MDFSSPHLKALRRRVGETGVDVPQGNQSVIVSGKVKRDQNINVGRGQSLSLLAAMGGMVAGLKMKQILTLRKPTCAMESQIALSDLIEPISSYPLEADILPLIL